MTLQVSARRFYCDRKACPRRTFSEPFRGFLARYQRRTQRLGQTVQALGLALGGEAGARLAGTLGVRLSPDTLLRAVRRSHSREAQEPRIVGVDDWAFRRGHTYGTILVDLERHRPIDLLPDRKAETLAGWLKQHPGITLISRDRAGPYAEGARRGAPQARQVADRWHLLKNLRETVERLLNRYGRELQWSAPQGAAVSVAPPEPHPKPLTRAERNRLANRERRLARYYAILELRQQGWSISAIAHHLHLQRVTVRRFLRADGFPERAVRKPVPSLLDPFRPYLQQRWQAGCHNARDLFREIVRQGFLGSEALVRRAVRAWRSAFPRTGAVPRDPKIPKTASVSPRQASFWFLDIATSTEPKEHQRQQAFMAQLCERIPALQTARELGMTFLSVIRQREVAALPAWLAQAEHSTLPEFRSFVRGLRQDYAAVRNACRLPWSQGQVEGQVNRLKFIKRSMYGRAGFDLLKRRVLSPT